MKSEVMTDEEMRRYHATSDAAQEFYDWWTDVDDYDWDVEEFVEQLQRIPIAAGFSDLGIAMQLIASGKSEVRKETVTTYVEEYTLVEVDPDVPPFEI